MCQIGRPSIKRVGSIIFVLPMLLRSSEASNSRCGCSPVTKDTVTIE